MAAPTSDPIKPNRFGRHPHITLCIFIVVLILASDFLSAKAYEFIHGHRFSARENLIQKIFRCSSPFYHHDLAPNKQARISWKDFEFNIFTNSLGFRDKSNRNIARLSDRHRLLFIGDSFTEAMGFDYEDTFVGLIDSELSKSRVEVLNAGVASYSPVIYWKKIKYLLEDVGLRFDEAVVFIDISDIEDEALYYGLDKKGNVKALNVRGRSSTAKVGQNKLSAPVLENIFKQLKWYLKNDSILTGFVLEKLQKRLLSNSQDVKLINLVRSSWTINKDIYREYGQRGLEKSDLYMEKLYQLLNQYGIKLTVAVYPWPDQIYHRDLNSIQSSHWRDWCKKRQVSFIDYFPDFVTGQTQAEAEKIIAENYIEGDMHWNKKGHRLIAKVFLDFYHHLQAQAIGDGHHAQHN
ncbi:MAG: hypothetical protein EXS63_06080 [Candidatus Omnitrophica bacterium]|nr:hypothetical protein [Candidatus Omnitrophota bacterium]